MDSRFDQNKTELGVLILSVSLQMLTDLDSLLDKHVKILGDLRGKTVGLEKTNNLLSGDGLDLGDTVGVTQDDTNLGGGQTLLCKLANVFFDIRGRDLQPRRRSALVRAGTLRDTLSGSMHTTHGAEKGKRKRAGQLVSEGFILRNNTFVQKAAAQSCWMKEYHRDSH